jgi:hypothetical protein
MKTWTMALSVLAMLCSVAAWADKPERSPFGPFFNTQEEVTDCGDFRVLTDYTVVGYNRFYLNKDGSLDRLFTNVDFLDGIYYNSNEPSYWLPGTAEHAQQWLHFDDDETAIDVIFSGSPTRVILPGSGSVFMGVGRIKFDLVTGEVTFTGRFDQLTGNNDALCAALRP